MQFLQRVFSIDTVVKPLPPVMAYNVSRNLSFFTRIFTQFFGMLDLQHLFPQMRLLNKQRRPNIYPIGSFTPSFYSRSEIFTFP